MESLPEAVLIRILASIPAVDLVLACRLVCCQWKNLVDGAALWILKCQQEGLTGTESEENAENWQNFYFLSKKRRNLIKNPCGEEDLQHWGDVHNGGDGWKIEELPGDFGKEFPSEGVHKYFVTSYEWCRKSQVIDLRAEGYWEELMDTTQPKIVVKDWFLGPWLEANIAAIQQDTTCFSSLSSSQRQGWVSLAGTQDAVMLAAFTSSM
ncbi:F-box only protein 2 isoform X2 [Anas acuta]|uniref:F-box only protein 2 isoform X2 n=1 Tax=Anas acuta TaxID=28680 RepID=UPI0035C8A866